MRELSEFPFNFEFDDGWTDAPVVLYSNGSVDDHQGFNIAPAVDDYKYFLKDTFIYFLYDFEVVDYVVSENIISMKELTENTTVATSTVYRFLRGEGINHNNHKEIMSAFRDILKQKKEILKQVDKII
jgi:hypothetical protein